MNRGEIAIVEVFFSDRTGSKVRPVLVVQSDFLNQRLTDTIVAIITSSPRALCAGPVRNLLSIPSRKLENPPGCAVSVVQCENLATIDTSLIHAKIGHLSESLMREVDQCLKVALGMD